MSFDQVVKLFDTIISFLQVIAWPLIILIILLILRNPLKKFLENIGEINLKAGPFETTAKRQQQLLVASTSLGAATEHWQDDTSGGKPPPDPE